MAGFYTNNIWDEFFDDFFQEPVRHADPRMRTDVKETEDSYEIIMELPGVKKEDVKAELRDGNLTIQADLKQESGKYVRRERCLGPCRRSFFVGKAIRQEDIKAKFENGLLVLTVPKHVERPQVEENHFIAIE